VVWRYATRGRDVTIADNTYLAAGITRSAIKETVETPQDQITITFPYIKDPDAKEQPVTQSLGDNWHPYVPNDQVKVICMSYHAKDPDKEIVIDWQGRVSAASYTDGQFELTCLNKSTKDKGLRRGPKWGKSCWKDVYGTGIRGCNLSRDLYKITGAVTAINGLTVSAAEFADSQFSLAGGEFTWTRDDGIVESRPIMSHDGTDITVLYFGNGLAVGTAYEAVPDCPRNWAACEARDNTDNYGGSVYEPTEDAFSQSMSWS
jgi:hypothetical protein